MRLSRGALLWTVAGALALAAGGCDDGGGSASAGAGGAPAGGGGGAVIGGGAAPTGGEAPAGGDAPPPAFRPCADGQDNDGDGLVDLDDPGCEGPDDPDETNTAACDDGVDNDFDGFTDFPSDPGCGSPVDEDEFNDPVAPECNDGVDNDRDGAVDEQDVGCSSVADPSEEDPAERPACSDDVDNDEDGQTDFPDDPGCSAAGDRDERDPPSPPACANERDDDGDGLADYPADPGCMGRGDRDEDPKAVTPDCADGVDNDLDGRTDYPNDDGCRSASDYDERGPCGRRYDPPRLRDGEPLVLDTAGGVFEAQGSCGGQGSPERVVLYRLEREVEALVISTQGAATEVETTLYLRRDGCLTPDTEVACQTEAEGARGGQTLRLTGLAPGDYYIFVDGVAGAGGPVELSVTEIPLAECLNGVDDDGDGTLDYPADPGCDAPFDREERVPDVAPACSNDVDDDGDGLVDFPLDPGCPSAAAEAEEELCGEGIGFRDLFPERPEALGDTRVALGATTQLQGGCGGAGEEGGEVVYRYRNPYNARLIFSTRHPETTAATVLYLRSECADSATQLGCDGGAAAGATAGRVVLSRAAPGDYFVVVDTAEGNGGPFKLTVDVERLPAGCADGRDNDGDGLVDGDDPGCRAEDDEDERDPGPGAPAPACNNGTDDDGDGLVDFPYDPGCAYRGADDETDPATPPICADGLDEDRDGLTDFPADLGCESAADATEENARTAPQCANRRDDDQDGAIDYPFDPDCAAPGDRSEAEAGPRAVCANGLDDDGDGLVDFPYDPGCAAASWGTEVDPEVPPTCVNGLDDDGDGRVDFPADPGCAFVGDLDEADPARAPGCANGVDDDHDGRTDWPDDPGCAFAADAEDSPGYVPPRCRDGVDNDQDGAVDAADPGCADGDDDDELDPDAAAICANGLDDDEDGLTDWPLDPGCLTAGAAAEAQACRAQVVVAEIPAGGRVLGSTAADGPDLFSGRCGGRGAPDAVYRYVLPAPADLRFSLANEGTDFRPLISVRRSCEVPTTRVGCGGNFDAPEPQVVLPGAEAGEYFIIVDGGGAARWASQGGPVALVDPQGFVAEQDVDQRCWLDGGVNSLDCYGDIQEITFGDEAVRLHPAEGEQVAAVGDYELRYQSSFVAQNIWRLHFAPAAEGDDRTVSLRVRGNLGSNARTEWEILRAQHGGLPVPYLHTWEAPPEGEVSAQAPVIQLVVPGDPGDLDRVEYTVARDIVNLRATDVKLPLTVYVAISFAPPEQVMAAILSDVSVQGGDMAQFGNFELTVTAE